MPSPSRPADPLLAAVTSITWLIVLNKPIYPLYVWYFVGDGVQASLLSILAAPFYGLVLLIGRRSSLAARVAFPIIATLDTICETKLFGEGSATELFIAPAALIAALSFYPGESRWLKGILAAMYVAFLAVHGHLGASIHAWTNEGLIHLREINIFAVASLTVFVGWKFAEFRARSSLECRRRAGSQPDRDVRGSIKLITDGLRTGLLLWFCDEPDSHPRALARRRPARRLRASGDRVGLGRTIAGARCL